MTTNIERLGAMEVSVDYTTICVRFAKRQPSPGLHPYEARILAKMLNAAASKAEIAIRKRERVSSSDTQVKMPNETLNEWVARRETADAVTSGRHLYESHQDYADRVAPLGNG